jgi:hypothetical protein
LKPFLNPYTAKRPFYRDKGLELLGEILAEADSAYEQALKAVQAMTDQDLLNRERFAWCKGDPMWHMVAANTWWHYKEHREQIEAWLGEKQG